MRTLQQLRHFNTPNPQHPAASARTKAAAFALTLFLLLGSFLSTRADPANTVMLPLLLSTGSQTLAANNDRYQVYGSETLTISAAAGVLANDTGPAPDELRAQLESTTTKGVLKLNEDGSFSYTPDAAFNGQDKFTYRAADNTAVSDPATVTLTVSYDPALNAPRIVTGDIAFSKQVIGTQVKRAHFAYAADFDEDGDLDVVATMYGKADGGVGGKVLWYENEGSASGTTSFAERVLDPDLAGAYPAHVADVNCDGHIDVLAAGYDSDTFAWYRNDGADQRSGSNQGSGANFTRINIDTAADGAHSIVTYDLDNDGDLDLVTSGQDGNFISWYENDGADNFQPQIIDDMALAAKRAEVADVDGDGDADILGASFDGREIAWYENKGNQNFNKHVIDDRALGAYYVEPADIDGDGDMDMFSANSRENTVAWYRNEGAEGFTRQSVDENAEAVRTVVAVDLDRDGDIDGLAASVDDDTVAWHENDGAGNFSKHVVDDDLDGVYSATAVDMDFDGDYDLLSASRNSGEITLHTQYKAHNASVAKGGTLLINSQRLLTTSSEESAAELVYTISGAPKFGDIRVDGSPVAEGGTFSQQDINDGRVSYAHTAANKTPDGFTFSVAGSGEGGVQPAAGAFTIKIN